MTIVNFTANHVKQAQKIALQNYNEERQRVTALPTIDAVPNLTPYAENGLGVAAFDGEKMLGFMCSVPPFKKAFRSTDAVGVFSPMGANGAVGGNRASIYARMYQAAGEKWVMAGASSHSVCLYAHDSEVQEQFFRYGFGMRCIDAIRGMDEPEAPICKGYNFTELTTEEFSQTLPLDHMLDAHMAASPIFVLRQPITESEFVKSLQQNNSIIITAQKNGQIIAYIRAELNGETFICDMPGYLHINGAYCLPEHRGKGVYQTLLILLIRKLKAQGYTRFGVDFESINPTAYGFWLKYFDAYTHSVVRRIDEHIITKSR